MLKYESKWTNPVFTVGIGGVIGFILMFIPEVGYVIGGLVGGYIATNYAEEKKIVYGVFAGIIASALLLLFSFRSMSYVDLIEFVLGLILIIILPATIGGYIRKKY